MNDWMNDRHRNNATRLFCEHLHKEENKQLREDCKTNPAVAKKVFAELGGFQLEEDVPTGGNKDLAIPKDTVFRVLEWIHKQSRDKYVDLVLPDPEKPLPHIPDPPTHFTIDVSDIYRCTWIPWSS